MKADKGHLYVVSAPSGTGKTTLCNSIKTIISDLKESVSFTTRSPRSNEVNDSDYTFIDRDSFKTMIDEDQFLEWAEVYNNYYGTSVKRVEEILSKGFDVLMDIDTQGASQIKSKMRNSFSPPFYTTFIFILPPSLKALEKRLFGRGKDSEAVIRERLAKSKSEIKEFHNYDFVIINDNIKKAIKDFESIIIANKLRKSNYDEKLIREKYLLDNN